MGSILTIFTDLFVQDTVFVFGALSFFGVMMMICGVCRPVLDKMDRRVLLAVSLLLYFITMDFGAVVYGYCSDMTRTVAVGNISAEQKTVYDTVLKAQTTACAAIKAGINCGAVDKIARDIIYDAGYTGCFGHSLGHGVGIDIHESPNLSPNNTTVLKTGNVVTVEPGIYIENKFGVRIEDMVYVTDDGCINLTKSDKKLIVL